MQIGHHKFWNETQIFLIPTKSTIPQNGKVNRGDIVCIHDFFCGIIEESESGVESCRANDFSLSFCAYDRTAKAMSKPQVRSLYQGMPQFFPVQNAFIISKVFIGNLGGKAFLPRTSRFGSERHHNPETSICCTETPVTNGTCRSERIGHFGPLIN
jgi:hypothetical protein